MKHDDYTFKHAGDTFQVWTDGDNLAIHVHDGAKYEHLDMQVPKADAPALALTILEAAGVEPLAHPGAMRGTPGHLRDIAHSLRGYIRERDAAIEAAAQEQADLEAEAVELLCAESAAMHPTKPVATSLRMWSEDNQKRGIALAKAARKLYRGADA